MHPISHYTAKGLTEGEAHHNRRLGIDPETAAKYKAWASGAGPVAPPPPPPKAPAAKLAASTGDDGQGVRAGSSMADRIARARAKGYELAEGDAVELPAPASLAVDGLTPDELAMCRATEVTPEEYKRRKSLWARTGGDATKGGPQ